MPLVDPNDDTIWSQWYSVYMDDGTTAGYERRAKDRILGSDHWRLLEALGITKGQSIIIVGSGFGWIAEDWTDAGYGPVICLDTSSWIQEHKAKHAIVPIYDYDILTEQGRSDTLSLLDGKADWIITEDVMPCLSDIECLNLSSICSLLGDNTAHWITPNASSPMNNKSIEEWKYFISTDLVVRRGGNKVI